MTFLCLCILVFVLFSITAITCHSSFVRMTTPQPVVSSVYLFILTGHVTTPFTHLEMDKLIIRGRRANHAREIWLHPHKK